MRALARGWGALAGGTDLLVVLLAAITAVAVLAGRRAPALAAGGAAASLGVWAGEFLALPRDGLDLRLAGPVTALAGAGVLLAGLAPVAGRRPLPHAGRPARATLVAAAFAAPLVGLLDAHGSSAYEHDRVADITVAAASVAVLGTAVVADRRRAAAAVLLITGGLLAALLLEPGLEDLLVPGGSSSTRGVASLACGLVGAAGTALAAVGPPAAAGQRLPRP